MRMRFIFAPTSTFWDLETNGPKQRRNHSRTHLLCALNWFLLAEEKRFTMFTPRRDSPLRGSPYGSPFDQSRKSPFSAGSVTRTGKPRGAARPSFGVLDTTSLVGGKGLVNGVTVLIRQIDRDINFCV